MQCPLLSAHAAARAPHPARAGRGHTLKLCPTSVSA
eukprot:CAMPEP_0114130380 /NCGR_PEP_ID=MMETSP0043_2-20121206/11986_1 /TAXON_ID=464988 /ORGANISM="Hemiselmis andersenii, Strain CCMP644" /LENGTH=35 /DNA_ID= /DNA_START= /DNA_END= /DNA_ORIENTATION=